MSYLQATAEDLYAPSDYISSVLATRPVPSASLLKEGE
jgi:hypothetical protein